MANQTKKQNTAGGGLYIALAICILSVICIGVYSAIISIFDSPTLEDPIVEQEKNEGGQKLPEIIVETPKVTDSGVEKEPEKPVVENQEEEAPEQNVNAVPTPPSYTMPVAGEIAVAFSNDVLVYSETMNDYRVHNGVDLSAVLGTPVKAFTGGVVLQVYEDPLMGQTVVIDHGNGLKSTYQNLSPELASGIEVGVEVKEGQVIGGVGESALIECAIPPHLHFEVTENNAFVDPMRYFQ